MNVFEGIEHVPAEGTPNRYFEAGQYVVTIESVFLYEKRLGGGKLFIVETTINESDNPNIKPGEQRNWVQSFAIPSALPRIKSFIGTAVGLSPKSQLKEINSRITADICAHVVGPENPLKGKTLKLTCTGKVSSKGKEFVLLSWGQI